MFWFLSAWNIMNLCFFRHSLRLVGGFCEQKSSQTRRFTLNRDRNVCTHWKNKWGGWIISSSHYSKTNLHCENAHVSLSIFTWSDHKRSFTEASLIMESLVRCQKALCCDTLYCVFLSAGIFVNCRRPALKAQSGPCLASREMKQKSTDWCHNRRNERDFELYQRVAIKIDFCEAPVECTLTDLDIVFSLTDSIEAGVICCGCAASWKW